LRGNSCGANSCNFCGGYGCKQCLGNNWGCNFCGGIGCNACLGNNWGCGSDNWGPSNSFSPKYGSSYGLYNPCDNWGQSSINYGNNSFGGNYGGFGNTSFCGW